uniref:Uncharacterized protein n=1 Tax=Anguilla anguilla TaxID=7936 RepID=A0A0E9WGM8_ANGAN
MCYPCSGDSLINESQDLHSSPISNSRHPIVTLWSKMTKSMVMVNTSSKSIRPDNLLCHNCSM